MASPEPRRDRGSDVAVEAEHPIRRRAGARTHAGAAAGAAAAISDGMKRPAMKRVLACVGAVALAASACGGDYGAGSPGDFGATVGGIKDLRLARDLIARGQVPPAAAVLVEAMFAEHDLGLAGPPCAETLCLRGGLGIAPGADGEARGRGESERDDAREDAA